MMTTIQRVTTKGDLRKFARFNYHLYKGNPYSVPDLYSDIMRTFSKDRNPAFKFCEAEYFLAYQNNRIVGRVAAIINHKANAAWNKKAVRFGWIDFIDDPDVSRSLIKAVEQWGLNKGMTEIEGPLGFTDFDAEGTLIEGFDQLSTMSTIYNYPYYSVHFEHMGFSKAMDWIEMKLAVPEKLPEQYEKIAQVVKHRYNLHIRKLKNIKEIRQTGIGHSIFKLINEAYKPLYGFCELSDEQIELCGELGWEYVDSIGAFHIFRTYDAAAPELNTTSWSAWAYRCHRCRLLSRKQKANCGLSGGGTC